MNQLTQTEYADVFPLFQPLRIHLAVEAALAGAMDAQVYVDRAQNPRAGLLWLHHRIYLTGSPAEAGFNQDCGRLLNETIFPALKGNGAVIYYADPAWDAALTTAILPDNPPIARAREYYAMRLGDDPLPLPAAPDGFVLKAVDPALAENKDLANLDDLLEEMLSERPSVEDFLRHSFGTLLLHENTIVTWVLSEYNLGQRCEVGIATHPEYQRRGLAALTGRAFIEQARAAGMREIGWHCWKDNVPSGRAALAIGFEKAADVPSSLTFGDAVVTTAVRGDICFWDRQYADAAAWFDRAAALGDLPGWACLNAACAHAELGNEARAFERLLQAVERGVSDPQHLQSVPGLASLHDSPQWRSLMARLRESS